MTLPEVDGLPNRFRTNYLQNMEKVFCSISNRKTGRETVSEFIVIAAVLLKLRSWQKSDVSTVDLVLSNGLPITVRRKLVIYDFFLLGFFTYHKKFSSVSTRKAVSDRE